MLNLTSKTFNFNTKLFGSLSKCHYNDYKIYVQWRMKNLGSMTPLFAPSLASQMNQMFSQIDYFSQTSSESSENRDHHFKLRATQTLAFEPTYQEENMEYQRKNIEEFDGVFKKPLVPEPAYNRRSPRFLSSARQVEQISQDRAIQHNIQRNRMINEETLRQKNSVKLYRKYRIGELPDVEISNSSIIIPLQELLKKDQTICKDLTIAIVSSVINQCITHDYSHNFIKHINDIFQYILEDQQENNRILAIVLEIMFKCRKINYSPELVAKVSKSNEFNVLGALLLEENLIDSINIDEPSKIKKIRLDDTLSNKHTNEWVHLASLYTSMNDLDIVLNIFNNHDCGETIKKASIARATHDWEEATKMYYDAYKTSPESIKEHCFQGVLECSSQMCDWETIERLVVKKLNKQWDNIWDNEWMDILFPWVIELNLRKALNQDDSVLSFCEASSTWLQDKQKTLLLERVFGKELAVMQLHNQPNAAQRLIINRLDEIREQWMGSSPLLTQLRDFNLQVLREISEIDRVLKILLPIENETISLNNLLAYWNDKIPLSQDNLLTWDRIISYRRFFQCILQTRDEDTQDFNDIHQLLNESCFKLGLNLVEAALYQKNKFIAQHHKDYIEQKLLSDEYDSPDLIFDLKFISAKLKYLYGDVSSDVKEKVGHMISSWKYLHLLKKESMDSNDERSTIKITTSISHEALNFIKLMKDNEECADLFSENPLLLKHTKSTSNERNSVIESLDEYCWKNLKYCCDTAPDAKLLTECHCNIAKYCYDKLSNSPGTLDVFKQFIKSTLRVMCTDSLETSHYFPCLLKSEYMKNEDMKTLFSKEANDIPTWKFISWQAQLFSYLGTTIADVVVPIIKKLVEKYPNAVVYTFYLNVDHNLSVLDPSTYRMRRILYETPGIERFLKALEYVVQPELYLRQHLIELSNDLLSNKPSAVEECINKVYPEPRDDRPSPGIIYNIISSFKEKIKRLEGKTKEEIKPYVQELERELKSVNHRRSRKKLIDYSPWLYKYKGENLEIPGQYTDDKKPRPYYHVKIVRVESTIQIMTSLRKPIKITFLGNDGKYYSFLVKYGEDLRLDQRIQQLFTIMNQILSRNVDCRQRRLSIDTYQVIPLSTSMGIIQWIDDTKSLQDFIHFKLSENEKDKYLYILNEYSQWINDAAPNKTVRERYKKAILKYSGSRVVRKMNELIEQTEWDALRRVFLQLSSSPESFMYFRRNFITSYATMCLAQWILGIGDRHLDNTLIVVESGRSLGIDFGLAFDAAVDQSVPELIPLRLTPQILGILKPFTEKDLLATTMVHTLNALKHGKESIIACMDVFVNEPMQWTKRMDKSLDNQDEIEDVRWLPDRKIQLVMKKLNGMKPSLITLEQLKDYHNDECYERYCSIVSGTDDGNTRLRATIKDDNLTSEEQIECLLDQATDLNVLGRTWEKWQPWL